MNPAPSVIVFTVLSGLGFGFLAWLCTGIATPSGLQGLLAFALGYALAVGGLLASTFHLGQPTRAWRAFTQWRSSWLSREAWVAVAALLAVAPVALGALWGQEPGTWGLVAAALCLGTVLCTSMIYAQLATVPRWNHPLVPVTFLLFALAGGAGAVLTARLADRVGKGIRGAPRDALVADMVPEAQRGAAYGLRQSMDTVGALLGPLLAMALLALTGDVRTVFWLAILPAMIAVARISPISNGIALI